MNALIVLGHPRTDSLCGALAEAYRDGAAETDANVRELRLAELEFDPDVRTENPEDQRVEEDLARARERIRWADHLVFVYPNWWGTMPALLKGFLDRALTPGFAFSFYEDGEGAGHRKLLRGKTAELLVTMDTPGWVYRWIQKRPGTNALSRATLDFVGVRTTRAASFGPVRESTPAEREAWLEEAAERGRSLETGPETRAGRVKRSVATWLAALRPQFYPMAWAAYTIGALAAAGGGALSQSAFWFGLGFLCFLEAATVLSNEYVDRPTDRENTFAGPFTGGSRVLVEGELGVDEVRRGAGLAAVLASAFGLAAVTLAAGSAIVAGLVAGALALLALGYTLPPLRLAYRSLGELDVAVTHSLGPVLFGFVLLGGPPLDPTPWLLALPFALSILPSITLAAVPDYEADRTVDKRTLAVRFGIDRAAAFAGAAALLAALVAACWQFFGVVDAYGPAIYLAVPHALAIVWLSYDRVAGLPGPRRIDRVMAASLAYIGWFAGVPLAGLA